MQWYASLLPRIHRFVPAKTILEIGPGFGRWTTFLHGLCDRLVLVDLSEKCIAACKVRFGEAGKITYHVNDGRSLTMVPDASVDFAFSYDSLVHAEEDVMADYLKELARVLTPGGAAFLHHSNAGQYAWYFRRLGWLRYVRPARLLFRLLLLETRTHLRALTMTADKLQRFAAVAGLRCVSQEMINWRSRWLLDCHSLVMRADSPSVQHCRVLKNYHFMDEARSVSRIAAIYSEGDRPSV
jgi:ubiquinone/menaquinone biosynthesis C-methylase UbiE